MSIYGYPEHLNPFYEEDNHRRLRFWKTAPKENKSSNIFTARRGSLNTLKQFLPFKNFSLRKRSSVLGINKTSESPPPLRRGNDDFSYDSSQHFKRDVDIRRSLQNVTDTNYRERNSRFLNSIETPRKHNWNTMNRYSGSSNSISSNRHELKSSTSMNSVSTNPFDDNDSNEDEISRSFAVPMVRRKKKRRAPLPPNLLVSPACEEKAINSTESREFSRLAAEFEDFVHGCLVSPEKRTLAASDENINAALTDVKVHVTDEAAIIRTKYNGKEDQEKVIKSDQIVELKNDNVAEPSSKRDGNEFAGQSNDDIKIAEQIKNHEVGSKKLEILETPCQKKSGLDFSTNKSVDSEVIVQVSPLLEVSEVQVLQVSADIRQFPQIQKVTPSSSRETTPSVEFNIPLPVREFTVLRIDEEELKNKPLPIQTQTSPQPPSRPASPDHPSGVSSPHPPPRPSSPQFRHRPFSAPQPPPRSSSYLSPTLKSLSMDITTQQSETEAQVSEVKTNANYGKFHVTRIRELTPIPASKTESVSPFRNFEEIPVRTPRRKRSIKEIIESINKSQQMLKFDYQKNERHYEFDSKLHEPRSSRSSFS